MRRQPGRCLGTGRGPDHPGLGTAHGHLRFVELQDTDDDQDGDDERDDAHSHRHRDEDLRPRGDPGADRARHTAQPFAQGADVIRGRTGRPRRLPAARDQLAVVAADAAPQPQQRQLRVVPRLPDQAQLAEDVDGPADFLGHHPGDPLGNAQHPLGLLDGLHAFLERPGLQALPERSGIAIGPHGHGQDQVMDADLRPPLGPGHHALHQVRHEACDRHAAVPARGEPRFQVVRGPLALAEVFPGQVLGLLLPTGH